jgi:hypothetical protein
VESVEKELILRTLNEVNWNRKEAARRLDICYKSLLNKIHRWQLGRLPESPGDQIAPAANRDGRSAAAVGIGN